MGPAGVIQDGWLSPEDVRAGMVACFVLATAVGLVILAVSTWWLLLLALPSLAAAVL